MNVRTGKSVVAWLLALAPLVWIGATFAFRGPGANPVETLTHLTGHAAFLLLLASLSVTPLRRWTQVNFVRQRRLLGLSAFAYAVLHFCVFAVFDHNLDPASMWEDVQKRPYITAGSVALLTLLPLAWTSTRGWQRRLGRRWRTLHRLVYFAAVAALIHVWWQVKGNFEPAAAGYAVALLALFVLRLGC